MWSAGSKSSTWAATWERNGDGSKRSMRLTGEAFARRPARNAGSPIPIAEITPTPVIQTSAPVGHVRAGVAAVVGRQGLGEVAHRRQRAARDRPGERPVDDRGEGGDARAEDVLDLDPGAAAGGLDGPGHVHAARRARDVAEPEPPGRGLVPGPAAPGHRDPEAEERDDHPPRDEVAHERAVGLAPDHPRSRVVGEEALPAGDVVGQPEHEVRRRGDVDPEWSASLSGPRWRGPGDEVDAGAVV